ncbi:MAG: twin-arginine translocase TatA/TatE family subunit [Bacteroidales bacterium]|nr:twin-arginine translocase TatA/TatE family subunit [Bacteroidales bacterium]
MLIQPLFIGTWELIAIVAIFLLLFGGKKIPELMEGIGKGVKSFKKGVKEIENEVKDVDRDESKKD